MAKFAKPQNRSVLTSGIRTSDAVRATHEGGRGYGRDPQSELFLLAVTNMVGEHTFYESGKQRDVRFVDLIHEVTRTDPGWLQRFIPWLRSEANMRTASIQAAAEFARHADGALNPRATVTAAIQRPDEPAEMLAYWLSNYGRPIPASIKRGVADAVVTQYNERNLLKYDGTNQAWRFGDVIDLVHPKPRDDRQSALFHYALDRRHKRDMTGEWRDLDVLMRHREMSQVPESERREYIKRFTRSQAQLRDYGYTWEELSSWVPGGMDAEAWESVIPAMGYMALLRNLRNFDKVGISDATRHVIERKLADPVEVHKSRQFPYRFYQAWKNVGGLEWGPYLEKAANFSLDNLPSFKGRTLIMIDHSASMNVRMSDRSEAQRWELATLFGIALATRCEHPDVNAYDAVNHPLHVMDIGPRQSILRGVDSLCGRFGGWTQTWQCVEQAYDGHDRIVVLTDEQTADNYDLLHPSIQATPGYVFNLAGYRHGASPSGRGMWHTFGGLSDACYKVIALLEERHNGGWPF